MTKIILLILIYLYNTIRSLKPALRQPAFISFIQGRPPALSFKIAQDYFENNLNDQADSYVLNNGFYERTIPEDELSLTFDSETDGKMHKLHRQC